MLDASRLLNTAGLMPAESFLDIGCGDGHFSIAASAIVGPAGVVYAIEKEPIGIEMLSAEIVKLGIKNIRAVVMDATKELPGSRSGQEDGKQTNVILMSNILHDFVANGEIGSVMEHIDRVHAKNGRLIIIEFKKEETEYGPPLSVRLSEGEIESLFHNFGYQPSGRFEAGPAHNMLVLMRAH